MISFYTRALLLRRPPRWNKLGAARTTRYVTTRSTRRACRVVTCRDVTQQVEFGLMAVFDLKVGATAPNFSIQGDR